MFFPWRRRRSFTPVGAPEGKASFQLLRPKKGQQKFPSVFPKKGQQKSPSVPVSRLKSKIFTSNLVQKKFAPQPKSPGDAYVQSPNVSVGPRGLTETNQGP